MAELKKIDRYEIKEPLGKGGMATVYLAHDPHFGRDIAIKLLPREFLHDEKFRERFDREARSVASLEHFTIVPVYDYGEFEGQPFIVMRHMAGGSLKDRMAQGAFSTEEILKIISRIADALHEAHLQGIIHRDLKPGNILFDARGNAYLADFGIAKLNEATAELTGSALIGTPAYMSPEQVHGDEKIDGRSDVYSLGIILYEMLAGKRPFEADTPAKLAFKHVLDPIPNILKDRSDLPPSLKDIADKALAKNRDARFDTPIALSMALSDTLSGKELRVAVPPEDAHKPPTHTPTPPQPTPQPAEQEAETVDELPEPAPAVTPETPAAVATPPSQPLSTPVSTPQYPPQPQTKGMPSWAWLIVGMFATGLLVGMFALASNRDFDEIFSGSSSTSSSRSSSDKDKNENAPDNAADDSPLVIGTTDSWTSFEPAWVYSYHDWELFHNCADGLLNNVEGEAGAVKPALAESYDVSDDGLVYTFHLREGVVFPDGTPFNADAVVFSFERIAVVNAAEGENAGFLYTAYTTGVEKIDNMTVVVTFADTFAFAPQLVATNVWKILNPNAYSTDSAGTTNTACGIGPYVIESFTKGEELIFVENESYYGDAPKEAKVIVRYFADSSTMALALQTGEIDIAWKSLSPSDTEAMRSVDGITVESQPGTEIRYIVFNTNAEPFDNADVRLGLAKLLDRQELTDLGFQGVKVPLYSMVPSGFLGFKPSYEGTENMDEGIALLASAGFTAETPLVMDLWYSPTHYGDTEADVAALMKSQWEASGVVQVTLQFLEWGAYRDASRNGEIPVSFYGWYPDYIDSDNYLEPFVPGTWAAGWPGFVDEKMSSLIAAQASEGDEAARIATLGEIQDYWVSQSPMVPFAQGSLFVAYSDGITNVILDPPALLHYYLVNKE